MTRRSLAFNSIIGSNLEEELDFVMVQLEGGDGYPAFSNFKGHFLPPAFL